MKIKIIFKTITRSIMHWIGWMILITATIYLVGIVPLFVAQMEWLDWLTVDSGLVVYSNKFALFFFNNPIEQQNYWIGLGVIVYLLAIYSAYGSTVSDETCPSCKALATRKKSGTEDIRNYQSTGTSMMKDEHGYAAKIYYNHTVYWQYWTCGECGDRFRAQRERKEETGRH